MIQARRCRAELDLVLTILGMILSPCECSIISILLSIKNIISDLTSTSSEVLFEVWDQGQKIGKSDAFLGLAIGEYLSSILYVLVMCAVSVSELMVTNSQRHVVPLQGRPYEEDQVWLGLKLNEL